MMGLPHTLNPGVNTQKKFWIVVNQLMGIGKANNHRAEKILDRGV